MGKTIGVRLGAPVEPTIWTYQRIADTYGNIENYLRDFKNFAADDDTNGPVYFIRAMRDFQLAPSAQEVGKTWLNYAADGHGMYWWGGYGISTEHTAYANLAAGIEAPRSGSIAQNGAAVAEQIGGQIFIDSWGWVNPGNPGRAAEMAAIAASVSHDGDGLNGARFVAAMVAGAFTAKNIGELFEVGLSAIPPQSTYAQVAGAVKAFHDQAPEDWRACREMLARDFGYDRYPGICHVIPNGGALALAILYGEGKLPRTVEIATMCGWDTDCNAGNAGAIIGTFEGVQKEWDRYRSPINDTIIASGVTGSLNMVDIPTFSRELTSLGLMLSKRDVPQIWSADMVRRGLRFDFELEGSTHGFRVEGCNKITAKWSRRANNGASGALEVLADRIVRGQQGRVFYKPFYRQAEFDDERYRPMFSPQVASGQVVEFDVNLEALDGDGNLRFVPYTRRAMSGKIDEAAGWQRPEENTWTRVRFEVPESGGEAVDEVGILVEYFGRLKFLGRLYLANFEVSGPGITSIDPFLEQEEWGSVTRFSFNRGHWKLEGGQICGLTSSDADLWTGHAYMRDASIRAKITPEAGTSHQVSLRVQGTARFYAAGFKDGCLVILREDFGTTILAETTFERQLGRVYDLELAADGDRLVLSVDGVEMLNANDTSFAYGMAGIRMGTAGRVSVGKIEILER